MQQKMPVQINQPPLYMTPNSITEYLLWERESGASENTLRRSRCFTKALYDWLPEDKEIRKDVLLDWRRSLRAKGYSQETELNYVKGINRYLDFTGRSDLRFNRGKPKDIGGMQFGYLTALEPTGERNRKDHVWNCQCVCGKTVQIPATRLLTGNTMSCGCLLAAHLREVNKFYDGTSLRQSLEERVVSKAASSGYTGVTKKRDKWLAYIKYKGRKYSLGCYTKLEDAVKARARAKELVRQDALDLLEQYQEQHKDEQECTGRQGADRIKKGAAQ